MQHHFVLQWQNKVTLLLAWELKQPCNCLVPYSRFQFTLNLGVMFFVCDLERLESMSHYLKRGYHVCPGKFAAEQHGAKIVDPKPYFVGSLKKLLQKYPHDFCTIPAIGYSPQQVGLCHHNLLADADVASLERCLASIQKHTLVVSKQGILS